MSVNFTRTLSGCMLFICSLFSQADTRLLQQASRLLEQAETLEMDSVSVFGNANQLMQQIKTLRADQRNFAGTEQEPRLVEVADVLNEQRQQLQQLGSRLRQHSTALKTQGKTLLKDGFLQVWPDRIHLTNTMHLLSDPQPIMAHNTQVRSVHPTMLNRMDSGPDIQQPQDMTMAMPAMGGQQAPEDLDVSTFQVSRQLHYFAHIEPLDGQGIPLNNIHQWTLWLTDAEGNPVTQAHIDITGHMPGHVHGLPTQPQITDELSPGEYRVDGIKFQMTGWWVMQFEVHKMDKQDTLTFNLVL
ncbi:FixH family protein [Gynuella sp.]|uniref:FixH family protein n=1 Tax=Gynuella sp. TaxID=2969146 RepID=UPI003D0ACEC9